MAPLTFAPSFPVITRTHCPLAITRSHRPLAITRPHLPARLSNCTTRLSPRASATLLERLGGPPALEVAVNTFYTRMTTDPALAIFFVGADMVTLRRHQYNFMSFAFSSGATGKGYDTDGIRKVHRRVIEDLGCNETHFDLVAGHLAATLEEMGVENGIVGEVLGAVTPFRDVFKHG